MELKGSKTIGGEDCYEIHVTYANDQQAIWHFSKKDFLPRARQDIFRNPGMNGPASQLKVLTDLVVDPSGEVHPTSPPTGASTFGDPRQAPLTGHYHRVPAGTVLPEGIGVVADGVDVGGPHLPTHHTVFPTRTMRFSEFVEKFLNLPWEYAGKKK